MKDVLKKIIKFDFTPTIILYVLFMVLTGLLVYVDIQPIGPGGSHVGLGTVNKFFFDNIGTSVFWYKLTEILGKITILYVIGFAIFGLVQWLHRQKLRRVDKDLFVLAFIYVLVGMCYVLFELFVVNFRPVLVKPELEASYPSSHTMLVITVMATAMMQFYHRIPKKVIRIAAVIISGLILVVTVVGRLLSGVHWFTDIMGAILLGATLVTFYYALVKRVRKYEKMNPNTGKKKVRKK